MNRNILSLIFLTLFPLTMLNAQMSTRTDAASDYTFGTRPVKGTKLLTFNLDISADSVSDLSSTLYSKLGLSSGRLFTAKYFYTDNIAFRAGVNLTKTSNVSSGDIDTSLTGGFTLSNVLKRKEINTLLVPGAEYHFKYTNIFDVYTGTDLVIGKSTEYNRHDETYINDYFSNRESRTSYFALGITPFVGLNVFVLDLPISLGLEYGFNALWKFGGATKVESTIKDASGEKTTTYYTQDSDAEGNTDPAYYSSLSKRNVSINSVNNLRLTLNIYFE